MIDFDSIQISIYRDVRDTRGEVGTLGGFLQPCAATIEKVNALRSVTDKQERNRIKTQLPQAAISGVFAPPRSDDNLITHSGFVVLDFDAQDNHGITAAAMKQRAAQLQYVCYCGLSASGKGAFAIVPIAYPAQHEQQYNALVQEVERFTGLVPDPACKNLSRLRAASYDDSPFINRDAASYTGILEGSAYTPRFVAGVADDKTLNRLAECVTNLERFGIDLTGTYQDWLVVGFSLASLGEPGREYYHRLSAINPAYQPRQCDRKFDNLLRNVRGTSIGSFFYLYNRLCGL